MKGKMPRGSIQFKKSISLLGNPLIKQATKCLESFPNENLFGENDYKMKKNYTFEQDADEENYRKNSFIRFHEILTLIIIINMFRNFTVLICHSNYSLIEYFLTFLNISSSLMCFMIIYNLDKFANNLTQIRFFVELESIFTIAFFTHLKKYYNFEILFLKLLNTCVINVIFNENYKRAYLYYFLEICTFCAIHDNDTSNIFSRFYGNFFSYDAIRLLLICAFIIILQLIILVGNKELWALYDSFKRSYFTLKNISDELPFPVFILNIKRQLTNMSSSVGHNLVYQTYYKNTEAEKLCTKLKKLKDKGGNKYTNKNQKIDYNFKDLFEKSVEKLLDNEIEKCLFHNKNYFDFPLIIGDNTLTYKQSNNFSTLYSGNLEKITWVRIIVSPTLWKGQECLTIQIMENDDIQHSYFTDDYQTLQEQQLLTVIDNVDAMCKSAPMKTNDTKSPGNMGREFVKTGTITPENLRSPNPSNNKFLKSPIILGQKIYKSPGLGLEDKNLINLKPMDADKNYDKLLKFTTNSKERKQLEPQKGQLTLNFNQNKSIPTVTPRSRSESIGINIKLSFDYSTLFLLKSSLNFLYDSDQTLKILTSLRMKKIQKNLTNFHFESLIKYFISYLAPVLKQKNIIIDLFSEIDGEISAIYDYYRVIFFNTILFIINNSSDKTETEKTLNINVMHVRFSDEGSSYYEVSFLISDDNPKIPYTSVETILTLYNKDEQRRQFIEKYKIIDIGLLLSSLLVNVIYNSEFKISSTGSSHKISFLIHNHGTGNEGTNNTISDSGMKKIELEDKYYTTIIEKLYKAENTKKSTCSNLNSSDSIARKIASLKNSEEDDKYNPDEEKDISLAGDWNIHNESHLQITNNFESNVKISQIRDYSCKFDEIREKSKKLKYSFNRFNNNNNVQLKWDNTSTRNNIKYCPIPRFLIVEDNIIGRMSIKDELKRLRIENRHDIAADGREAVDKFKFLFNQGYIFDFIFMDIYLPEMGGVEATKAIRNIESSCNVHSNIVAVTVEGKKDLEQEIFDEYFEKPIKNSDKFFSYIQKHFKNNRPEISYKEFK